MSRPTLDQMHPERPFRVHETDAYKGEQVIACLYGSNAWSVDANGNRLQVLGLASAFTVLDKDGEYDHTIATLTAEREKVRELVEAVLKERDLQAQSNGYISYAIDDVYELAQTLAAQLREQDDE